MRTVIVGAGLVGLTTAASLRLIGHEVTVLEHAPRVRADGAGIGLWPNALREFDLLGIGERVRRMGEPVDAWFFDAAGNPQRAEEYGPEAYRFLMVPRPELTDLLASTAGRNRIRLGAHVTGFTERDEQVLVHLADVPAGAERPEGTMVTLGGARTRGGYTRVAEGRTMWWIAQFEAGELVGGKRDRALLRARQVAEDGWHDELLAMIAATPEEAILENQVVCVPELPRWTTGRVALIGDAAHGLSPHIAAGGTLGIEDAGVLRAELTGESDPATALARYGKARRDRFAQVRAHADAVEHAQGAAESARRYAAFSHWMLSTAPSTY